MAHDLPEEIRSRATQALLGLDYLELCDPGTCFSAEGHTLVAVKDKVTGRLLWLDISESSPPVPD